jgi:hypothetical protein
MARVETLISTVPTRAARFFLDQTYQNGKIIKRPYIISNGHTLYQTALNYTNIFHSKALQNIPKSGFLSLKINLLATLVPTGCDVTEMRREKNERCFQLISNFFASDSGSTQPTE